MKKIVLALLVAAHSTFGQTLSKQDLINDLSYLNEAVVHGHPMNYDPDLPFNLLHVIDEVRQLEEDDLLPGDYVRWVRKAIFHIGCIHTSIRKNPLLKPRQAATYLPLTAAIYQNNLIITSCTDSTKIGQQIERINGVNHKALISRFGEYAGSDGISSAFSHEYFHFNASLFLATALGYPDAYQIKTTEEEFVLNAIDERYREKSAKQQGDRLLSSPSSSLVLLNDIPVLQVTSFDKKDRQFFRDAFQQVNAMGVDQLVIDLRQNTGGNRKAAVQLTSHLVDTTFSYSILQPKLKTFRYLNGKGKFFFLLSKLKYNIGAFYKKRKTPYGKAFTYKYKPNKKHAFRGKVYVITDGFTASSSTMVTSWLKQFSDATFMGMQAGGGYNGNNGGAFPLITLPQSQIQIRFPAYRLMLDQQSEFRRGIIPEVIVPPYTDIAEIIAMIKAAEPSS